MGYSHSQVKEGSGSTQYLRLQRAASRADIVPTLVFMQKQLKARNFAVLRVVGAGAPKRHKLVCDMENWGPEQQQNMNRLLAVHGAAMLAHIEASVLPLAWSGSDHLSFVETPGLSALVARLEEDTMPFSGIAFPVRLGAVGNGFAVFTATSLNLTSDLIVEQHTLSCQIMSDLLALDERRSVSVETLSERELACLQLAGDGRISEEIAENLGLSVHTVNAYLGAATLKLDSVNRIQAIAKAIRLGYIH